MSWQKSSDGAATHPKLMKIDALPDADERLRLEVMGWLWGLSTMSAQHDADYYVEVGQCRMLGGSRTDVLIAAAMRVGLLTEHTIDGLRVYKLLEDENLWHIRSRAEKEWAAQQEGDAKDPALKVPMVLRDGDNCRYCGVLTQWRGTRHHASWTMDHRVPGQAGTVETVVVACWRCNTSRSNNPQWDDDHPLRPVPTRPLYGRWAAEYLTNNGYPTVQNVLREADDERPTPAETTEPAPQPGVRPVSGPGDDPAPSPRRRARQDGPKSAGGPPDIESHSSGSQGPATGAVTAPGSGRVGSGSGVVGSGVDGSGSGGGGSGSGTGRRRRKRRGRRGGPR